MNQISSIVLSGSPVPLLLNWAVLLLLLSGLPVALFSRRSQVGQMISVLLMILGSGLGLAGVGDFLSLNAPVQWTIPWFLPFGEGKLGLDALSTVFLLPVFLIPALGAVYGLGYWSFAEHSENARRFSFFYSVLAGGMALVVLARDGVLLLFAWEAMALAAFFLVTAEEENADARQAGWVYLVCTHIGVMVLIAFFSLWHGATGSFRLEPYFDGIGDPVRVRTFFLLALIGFGFKAGLFPLHVWLPGAHANAPSHVSAVMSGVMIKMGVYGVLRVLFLLPPPPAWWGGLLLGLGAITAVGGIVVANAQGDLKRVLAYSSIENIGVIFMGIGLATLGRANGTETLVALGLGGALFHVWNHSLFKPLLFLNAGAVIHATGTRVIDRMGGLARSMPLAGGFFAIGAVAICALPPLNGFMSELLIYLGFFNTLSQKAHAGEAAAAFAAPALAMTGALAMVGFVKLFGTVFLGQTRTPQAAHGHDPNRWMLGPMAVLVVGCLTLGLAPWLGVSLLDQAVGCWSDHTGTVLPGLATLVPFHTFGKASLGLWGLVAVGVVVFQLSASSKPLRRGGTWDCGFARPTPRMGYTGTSFVQYAGTVFSWLLWNKESKPWLAALFPKGSTFKTSTPDVVLDRGALPLFSFSGDKMHWFRILQQGKMNIYMLYFLIILLFLSVWAVV